jgi:cytochrome P450
VRAPVLLNGPAAAAWYFRFWRDPLQTMVQSRAAYGPFIQLPHPRFFTNTPRPFLVAIGADFNREVLGDPTAWRPVHLGPDGRKHSASRRVGMGLIRMRGRQHEHYRRLISRPLQPRNVNAMGADMVRLAEEEVAAWPVGQVIDLWAQTQRLMRTLAIGLLFGDDRTHGYPIADMINRRTRWSAMAAFCPLNVPGTAYHRMQRNDEILERRIIEWANCKRGSVDERDILSLIVASPDENGDPLHDQMIAGHIATLFGAAYETCQNALIWTLVLLSQHPQIARDLFDELEEKAGGVAPDFDRLVKLPLLAAVVKESMRILPIAPQQMRVALRASTLAGYPVPPYTRVVLSSLLTNRDPKIYCEADRFKPERWAAINPSPYEYLVFSAGPRGCPGYWFGLCAVKAALAAIMTRFRIAIVPNTRIDFAVGITMSPRRGIPAVLHDQDGAFTTSPIRGGIRKMVQLPN